MAEELSAIKLTGALQTLIQALRRGLVCHANPEISQSGGEDGLTF
jgi:hypothetical protein